MVRKCVNIHAEQEGRHKAVLQVYSRPPNKSLLLLPWCPLWLSMKELKKAVKIDVYKKCSSDSPF